LRAEFEKLPATQTLRERNGRLPSIEKEREQVQSLLGAGRVRDGELVVGRQRYGPFEPMADLGLVFPLVRLRQGANDLAAASTTRVQSPEGFSVDPFLERPQLRREAGEGPRAGSRGLPENGKIHSRTREHDGHLEPVPDVTGQRKLATRVRPGVMRAAAIGGEESAGATLSLARDELVRTLPPEFEFGCDLKEAGPFAADDPRFGVAAEPAVGPAFEAEPLEQRGVELRGGRLGVRHAFANTVHSRTVLIPRASRGPMVLVAKDIMEKTVLTVDEGVDALTCARTMSQQRKGYAVLIRAPGTIAGIVTEWDYLSKVVAPGLDPAKVSVRDIATAVVDSCGPDTPTDVVVATMSEKGVRRMVVRSGDQLLGIITARTVLRMFREYVDKVSSEIAGFQASPTTLG
jgi:CBS domain-containing protein